MKTIKFLTIVILSIFLSTAVTSCKGDDGADGIDGVDGAQGPAGQDGQDGNANVIYSDWFSPTWTVPSTSAYFNYSAPEITQEVLDTGVIMVYMRIYNHVYPMPISFMGDTNPKEYDFWADLESLRIWFSAESSYSPSSTIKFRYVIIPGNNNAAGRSINSSQSIYDELSAANVDINNYEAVCDYYGISY